MSPLLPALLAPALLAFDLLKTDALSTRIGEVTARAQGPVLVAAAGGDAWRTLAHLRHDGGATWQVERVSLMGDVDTEMLHVLTAAHARCGLRVAPGGLDGEWIVSEHGDCGQGALAGTDDAGWLDSADSGHKARGAHPANTPSTPANAAPAATPMADLDPTTLLLLDKTVPDPTTALLSSTIVGFGAGHFYAHDATSGWVHAGLQAGGILVFGLGRMVADQAFTSDGVAAGQAISVVGASLFVGSRLVDAATAPYAASADARRQIERQLR